MNIWLWIALVILLVFIEMITPLELLTIWFIPAVLVSWLLDFLNVDYRITIAVFIILILIGSVCMFFYFKNRQTSKDLVNDKFKGNFIIESVNENGMYRIVIKGVRYFVEEQNNIPLDIGDMVETIGLSGNKIMVKKIGGNK